MMFHPARTPYALVLYLLVSALAVNARAAEDASTQAPPGEGWQRLFAEEGVPQGWRIGAWNDVSKPGPEGCVWKVEAGILRAGQPRGSWLISEEEYENFELAYDFKLSSVGNSGLALRAPMRGDPAFDGLELQMADYRYNPSAKDSELTGGLYRALAPRKQVYRPEAWNHYHVILKGSQIHVTLNDEVIQDNDLSEETQEIKRHDDSLAVPLKDRPRKGHLGFQELSKEGEGAQIRNVWLRVLE